jgi:hypothetical protein
VSKKRRVWLAIVAALMVSVVWICSTPAYQGTVGDVLSADSRYDRAYSRAVRAGAIVSAEDFRARYALRGRPNAAPLYTEAEKLLSSHGIKVASFGTIDGLSLKLRPADLDKALGPFRIAKPLLVRAMAIPDCDLEVKYEDPIGFTTAPPRVFRTFARIYVAEAVVASAKGHGDLALDHLESALKIGDAIGQCPWGFFAGAKTVIQHEVLKTLVPMVSVHQEDARWLARARGLVLGVRSDMDFRKMVECEVLINEAYVTEYDQELRKAPLFGAAAPPMYERVPAVTRAWKTRILEYWAEVFENAPASRTDWKAWLAAVQPIDTRYEDMTSFTVEDNVLSLWGFLGLRMTAIGNLETHRNLVLSLLDVADWSLSHHSIPTRLPYPRPNPFDSAPVRGEAKGRDFLVWYEGRDAQGFPRNPARLTFTFRK